MTSLDSLITDLDNHMFLVSSKRASFVPWSREWRYYDDYLKGMREAKNALVKIRANASNYNGGQDENQNQ